MGTWTTWREKCSQCGEEAEFTDNSSSMFFSGECQCGWEDTRSYYYMEEDGSDITLCTPEQAEKEGLLKFNINRN